MMPSIFDRGRVVAGLCLRARRFVDPVPLHAALGEWLAGTVGAR